MGLAQGKKVRFIAETLILSLSLALVGQNFALAEDSTTTPSESGSAHSADGSSKPLFEPAPSSPLFGESSAASTSPSASTPTTSNSGTTAAPPAPSATAVPGVGSSGGASGGGAGGEKEEYTPVNPLKGLFQMQPQYPTPGTTQMFPEAVSPNLGKDSNVQGRNPGQTSTTFQTEWKDPYAPNKEEKVTPVNPIKGLFQQQPQYPTPGTTQMYPEAVPNHLGHDAEVAGRSPGQASEKYQSTWKDPYAPPEKESKDKENYLKGLFQPQPQYVSPGKTVMFPEAVQKNLGNDAEQPGRQPGQRPKLFGEDATADVGLPGLGGIGGSGTDKKDGEEKKEEKDVKDAEKKEGDKDAEKKDGDKDKEGKDAEKKDGDKDKDKDAKDKDKDGKDKDKDGKDKDKDAKDKDAKDGDKKTDADKKSDDKKSDDKKSDDKKSDADKKSDDKKSDDKKADADKKEKEEIKYAPFNPLREAITLMNSNHFQESHDLLTKEIKKQPNNPQAFYTRAVVNVRMRKYNEAAQDYNEVLKLSPTGQMAALAKAGLAKIKL